MVKEHWSMVHDESITASRSLRVLARVGDGKGYIDTPVLFERDDDGLYISYYFTAQDALARDNKIADICYGWDVLMAEGDDAVRLAWYDTLVKHVGEEPLSCTHAKFTCNEVFHAAAVLLGNEDEDNCAVCDALIGEDAE
jgi:hypothetical protein